MARRTFSRSLAALIVLCAGLAACALGPAEPDLEAGLIRLEAEMRRLERRGFVGQVVVARGQQALMVKGYGTRRPDGDEAVTPESVFALASVTKPLAASLILALEAEGRLGLDDPLGRHLPGLEAPWAEIPVENLLSHTSGLPAEIINRAWDGHPQFEPVARQTMLERAQRFPPDHPPGGGFNYSNVGYALIAALVERACAEPWEACLHERLLRPAGVPDIGFLLAGWTEERVVHGRLDGRDWGSFYDQPRLEDGLGFLLRGSGDLHATANGILAWWRAIHAGTWLPPEAMAAWLEPRIGEPDGSRYGLGLNFRTTPFGPAVGHWGSNRVFSTDLTWWPEHEIMVYIASADSRFQADLIRRDLHRRLLGNR